MKLRRRRISGAVAIALVSALVPAAGPEGDRTFHVATDGSDENPGSEAKPLRTIQNAASLSRAGDTILLGGGVYREAVVLRFSGREGRPIVLKNAPGERPVIQPGERGERPPGQGVLLQAEAGYPKPIGWITIEGLEIRYGWDGVKFYNAHDVAIRNCRIHDNYEQGILGNGNRVLIDRNVIAVNGTNKDERPSLMHGIYATGSAFTITNNIIHSNSAYGIQVAAYDYNKDAMAGPEYAEAKGWLIANNTLAFQKHSSGLVLWQDGVENCVVQNNIFYKNAEPNGIVFYTQGQRRHRVRNNIFFPPGESLASSEKDAYQAIDNRQADPRFADSDSLDFRLQAGSPAIDAGLADRAPKVDFEGKPRPQGGGVDIGALEFTPDPATPSARGPLRVHSTNPRYFAVDSGKAVYLTGSHTWNNLQDSGAKLFDYTAYLDMIASHKHNFMRMWFFEHGENGTHYGPLPYPRTGPGTARDGKPKFDVSRFDQAFFNRLRARVLAARDRGIYVSIMLFQGWSIYDHGHGDPWTIHYFNQANNINGVDGDPGHAGHGRDVHRLRVPAITALQEAYVRKVIDTVNDLDNIFYEITNETVIDSKDWQYHIIKFIKEYEAKKPRQHPVGMTYFDSGRAGSLAALYAGPADWISPGNGDTGDYFEDPPVADGRKVVINDTDHHAPSTTEAWWPWKAFLRGQNPIVMDGCDGDRWEPIRRALGHTRAFADRLDLASMVPRPELASTGYCLAHPGAEYLIYQPRAGAAFSVELEAGTYRREWFDPARGVAASVGLIEATRGAQRFEAPFGGGAVLYLKAR
jgi:hypothetical protein